MEQKKQSGSQQTYTTELTLLEQIAENTGVRPADQGYDSVMKAMTALITALVSQEREDVKADPAVVNRLIADIDHRISSQVDAILHDPTLQQLESAWRGLKFLVDRTDFRQNIKLEMLNVSKEDLIADFEDTPEIPKSGLYKHVYTAEYGTFGGEPVGAIIGNYDFGPGPRDIELLQKVASIATMAHAPFMAAASPEFFRVSEPKTNKASDPTPDAYTSKDTFLKLPNLKDIDALMQGPRYAKWNGFRESGDARSVGLTLPRFLLRLPYSQETIPAKSFNYKEDVTSSHEAYLWGNTAFAFATRLTDSFAKFRWCPNIIGPQGGGAVEDLHVHLFDSMGTIEGKIPTEVLISERREFELAEQGFIPLTMRKGSDNACFFSANSAQRPKKFGQSKEGKEAETNYKLGTELPYNFIVNRLAHYIKVLQREQLGTWKERGDLETELNKWIRQYVADFEAQPGVRARKPLRQAKITVSDVEGNPGWYKVDIAVRPHFKYMGAFFTLSLVGKLDK